MKHPIKNTVRALKTVTALAFSANKAAFSIYILLNILTAANAFVRLASTEYTINRAYRLFMGTEDFRSVAVGILLFALASLSFMLLDLGKRITENRLMLDVTYYFEHNLNGKLGAIKWDYYESHDTYASIHEVRTRTLETIKKMIRSIMTYITAIPLIIIFAYYLAQINIYAVIIYAVAVILFNRAAGKMFGSISELWVKIKPFTQRQNYFLSLCGDKNTHQEYIFNRLYGYASAKWESLYDSEYKLRLKIFGKHEITLQTARIVFNIPYIAMLIFVAYETAMGIHEIGFLLMANQLFNFVIDTFVSVQDNIANNVADSRFIKAYKDILELEEADAETADSNISHAAADLTHSITLSDITYTYPQSEYKALDGLDLAIKAGEKLAVVGVNGSGKTTCTNLIMSLTDRFEGRMTIDRDVSGDGHGDLHGHGVLVSCILQDFAQYQLSVRENIEVGKVGSACMSDAEILHILEQVGLREVVETLPNGINTRLGQLDKGVELSKGQWQRLAIARLLANPDADIWILDEPTAYLDPLSEIDIYDMIYNLAGHRTVLFISHRLGFAKRADRIVLFDHGRIAEQGTHDQLMVMDGVYANMYRNQESWYAA